jgi:hypothetical protein
MFTKSDIDRYSGYIVGGLFVVGSIVARFFDERFELLIVVLVTVSLTILLRCCGNDGAGK